MSHSPRPAFACTAGAKAPRLVLLGEAWGEGEEQVHQPFVGESGKELFRMLGEAMPEIEPGEHRRVCETFRYEYAWAREREGWLEAAGIAMTNVLALRPLGNKLEALCASKKEVSDAAGSYPPITRGKYLREEYLPELDRLATELAGFRPNLVVALGNTATWALLRATNIGSIRGAVTRGYFTTLLPEPRTLGGRGAGGSEEPGVLVWDSVEKRHEVKVLPTYHPAGVLRQWSWRPLVVADLMKAARESAFPEIRRPRRLVLVDPTIEEVERWTAETLASPPRWLAPDVETEARQITCIGFARSAGEALVIPFWDRRQRGRSYWSTQALEERAWACVARLLESPIPKVFQNGLYDLQYISRMAIRPRACVEDTMLLHHALLPEMQKGLGFLGSIYTEEASWKLMRRWKSDSEKRDE